MKSSGLVVLISFLLIAGVVYSQVPVTPQEQGPGRLEIEVVRVPLLLSVTDNRGRLITNLKKEDFRIYEDGRLQTITNFNSDTDLPLSIALLIDSSGSIVDKLKFEQEAAIDFFFNTVKRKKDRATVISFDSVPYELVKDFTDEPEILADAVKKIRAGGGTAVYDAVYSAVKLKLAKEQGERRRLIILISDGDDTQSRYSLTEALELAQKNDVTVYAISTNKTSDTRRQDQLRGDDVLKKMVEETGGKAYFPLKLQDLASDFEKIGQELRSQYIIFYDPTNPKRDGTYRNIRVEMVDKKYKVVTRKGYYADSRSR
jgi:Ca-activated chloride channel homolog